VNYEVRRCKGHTHIRKTGFKFASSKFAGLFKRAVQVYFLWNSWYVLEWGELAASFAMNGGPGNGSYTCHATSARAAYLTLGQTTAMSTLVSFALTTTAQGRIAFKRR